jgi:drug/metabolite transporter (DMT)-like permease|tara:strand:- start:5483 stop:6346 length:864 start_codon:yes stop_codon:yes gene_type:complete
VRKFAAVAPWVFIVIWSSGFVLAKYALVDSDGIYFLSIRLLIAALILFVLTLILRQPVQMSRVDFLASLCIGLSLHGMYLAGVWYAIELGAPAGLSSVITSMQPIVVSIVAVGLLSEPLLRKQVVGLFLGLAGVILVVLPKLSKADGFSSESLAFLFMALAGSTIATLLQKKIGRSIPLMIGTTYQFAIAGIVLLLISLIRGQTRFEFTHTTFWTMTWAVLVTSIAAVLLLLWLLNRGSAAKVSSLFYLIPPMAVLQTLILFKERVSMQGAVGIALTVVGVALVITT